MWKLQICVNVLRMVVWVKTVKTSKNLYTHITWRFDEMYLILSQVSLSDVVNQPHTCEIEQIRLHQHFEVVHFPSH